MHAYVFSKTDFLLSEKKKKLSFVIIVFSHREKVKITTKNTFGKLERESSLYN